MLAAGRHRWVALAAVAAATLAAVTACGSAQNATSSTAGSSPAQAAQAGFSSLLDADALTATLTLDTDSATLVALSGAGQGSTPLSSGRARAIAGGSLVFAATTGGSFRQPSGSDGAFALTVNAGGMPKLAQIVVEDKTLYARAAVPQLLTLLGASGQVTTLLDNPALPPQLSFLRSAVAGDWLKLSLPETAKALGGSAASSPAPVPSVDPTDAAALLSSLQKIFRDETVTRAPADPTLGDHLVLSGNARTVGADLLAAVQGIAGTSTLLRGVTPTSLPDKQIRVDEFVDDGVVSALRIDLTPLLSASQAKAAAGRPVLLELELARSATITAPAHAVAVGPAALSGLTGLLGASGLGSALESRASSAS